jgi:uncharacterized protein (DUF488 family)
LTIEVLTIGHSARDYESFVTILRGANVTAIADVRSSPISRFAPHFSQQLLKQELKSDGVAYSFLGKELGGRPSKPELYSNGGADYEKMAAEENFKRGLNRVLKGAENYRIALMCSEYHPLDCHRCLLVGRALSEHGVKIFHLLSETKAVSQKEVEEQLIRDCGHGGEDMFAKGGERLAEAYRERSRQVSFRNPDSQQPPTAAE